MNSESKGQGSAFINRLGTELLMAPIYLMYMGMLLLGMYLLHRFVPAITFRTVDFVVVTGLFVLFYMIRAYISLGNNYHDIIVGDERIQIVNRIPGFKRQVEVPIKDIEEVVFTESHIDLEKPRVAGLLRETYRHPERKWLEIHTQEETLRWKCYGIEQGATVLNPTASYDDLYQYLKTELEIPVRRVSNRAA
ncbi:MAG: hypothetical protein AAGN35_19830 [Bacteroidota bacterium]